jgi:hypothetical protein
MVVIEDVAPKLVFSAQRHSRATLSCGMACIRATHDKLNSGRNLVADPPLESLI